MISNGTPIKSEARGPKSDECRLTAEDFFPYNESVGSRTGRSLVARREESPNSAEQCAG
jgi:hypothetical protein